MDHDVSEKKALFFGLIIILGIVLLIGYAILERDRKGIDIFRLWGNEAEMDKSLQSP